MAFTTKDWVDGSGGGTPLSAVALEDLETRLAAYTDTIAAGGVELGYAEITSDFSTTSTSGADVTGLTTTVTVASRPIVVKTGGRALSCTDIAGAVVLIYEGATALALWDCLSTTRLGFHREVRLTPSAGSHTYKVVLLAAAGTATITASGTGSQAFIQVIEV